MANDDVGAGMADLRLKISHLHQIGGERPAQNLTPLDVRDEILHILEAEAFDRLLVEERSKVLDRISMIYTGSWDALGSSLIPAIEKVSQTLFSDDECPLKFLCMAYDLLYFLYWCGYNAVDDQVGFGTNVVIPFCDAIVRRRQAEPSDDSQSIRTEPANAPERIAYLAEFITPGPGNAIAGANAVLLRTLAASLLPHSPPILYAWMFHDTETLAYYASLGIEVRAITGNSPEERIISARSLIAEDAPVVLITDMNAAVPTALFQYRVAPIQVFYQFGMPVWPVPGIDAIFHVWDFDFLKAGLGGRPHTPMTIPYDLTRFAAPADPAKLAQERQRLAPGRLIGTYGRLSKITPDFISAVAKGIAAHPDVTVVLGGSGDGEALRKQIEVKGMAKRILVIDGYVDGHLWGHLLDIFLDTFPVPGGASCLEVIAKGKPIISLRAREAGNLIDDQRIQSLAAKNVADYAHILDRLLGDADFYSKACEQTRQLAESYRRDNSFSVTITKAINRLTDARKPWPQRWLRQLKRFLKVRDSGFSVQLLPSKDEL